MFYAIYQKELKANARSIRMPFVLTIYNAILAFVASFSYYIELWGNQSYHIQTRNAGILEVYTLLMIIEFGMVLITMPVLSASMITNERERQTLDILMSFKIQPFKLLAGKLCACVTVVMFLIVSSVPIVSIVFLVGGVNVKNLLESFLTLLVTTVFLGTIGILNSVLFRKTTSATVATYAIVLALIGITFLMTGGNYVMHGLRSGESMERMVVSSSGGTVMYVLLINPVYTLCDMLKEQVGTMKELFHLLGIGSFKNVTVEAYRVWISNGVQLLVSICLLMIASYGMTNHRYCKRSERKV